MPHREISVRFNEPASGNATRVQRPHTAVAAGVLSGSSGAPFLDARGNRTQPSREEPTTPAAAAAAGAAKASGTTMTGLRRKKRKKRRPKTAIGIEHQQQQSSAASASHSASNPGGSEPNFPALNPRVFHALRGFLTPESLRKTKFYSDREEKMSHRRVQLEEQKKQLDQKIGGFYQRLDSFIAETNAAALWEPEDKRKQKSLLDDLDNL